MLSDGSGDFDVDIAESIFFALVDGEGDEEAAAIPVEVGRRRNNAGIGIAVLQVKLPQQLTIEIEPIRIVDIGALQEA